MVISTTKHATTNIIDDRMVDRSVLLASKYTVLPHQTEALPAESRRRGRGGGENVLVRPY